MSNAQELFSVSTSSKMAFQFPRKKGKCAFVISISETEAYTCQSIKTGDGYS